MSLSKILVSTSLSAYELFTPSQIDTINQLMISKGITNAKYN